MRTIRLYQTMTFFIALANGLMLATYATFLMAHGMDLLYVNLVNMVFFVTLVCFEIPTGAMADIFGRKASSLLGVFLHGCGFILYSMSSTFWGFAFAEFVCAIGTTFMSGAFDAWMVDQARHEGYTEGLTEVFSKASVLRQIGGLVSGVCGPFLARQDRALPWIVSGVAFLLISSYGCFAMREESFVRDKGASLRSVYGMSLTGLRSALQNTAVRFVFFLGTAQFLATQAPNMQWQPWFATLFGDERVLGFVWAFVAFATILGSRCVTRYSLAPERGLHLMQMGFGVSLIFAGLTVSPWMSLFWFLLHEAFRGGFMPLKDAYLHEHILSKERATVASCEGIAHHLGGSVGLLASGVIARVWGIGPTWIASGVFLLLATFCLSRIRSLKSV
jgi:MFS family permease